MKILALEDLLEKIKNIVNKDLYCNFKENKKNESVENYQDIKDFLEDNKNNKNILTENIDDILLFIETGFDLDHLNDEDFKNIYDKLKEIEINMLCLKLKSEYPRFSACEEFIRKTLSEIQIGNVVSMGEEVYLIKKGGKKTSKGYEIQVELLLSGTFSYVNSVYIDIRHDGFFVLGNII